MLSEYIGKVKVGVEYVSSLKKFRMVYHVPSGMDGLQFQKWKDDNQDLIDKFFKKNANG